MRLAAATTAPTATYLPTFDWEEDPDEDDMGETREGRREERKERRGEARGELRGDRKRLVLVTERRLCPSQTHDR